MLQFDHEYRPDLFIFFVHPFILGTFPLVTGVGSRCFYFFVQITNISLSKKLKTTSKRINLQSFVVAILTSLSSRFGMLSRNSEIEMFCFVLI